MSEIKRSEYISGGKIAKRKYKEYVFRVYVPPSEMPEFRANLRALRRKFGNLSDSHLIRIAVGLHKNF